MEKRLPGPPNLTCNINVGVNDSADQSTLIDWLKWLTGEGHCQAGWTSCDDWYNESYLSTQPAEPNTVNVPVSQIVAEQHQHNWCCITLPVTERHMCDS